MVKKKWSWSWTKLAIKITSAAFFAFLAWGVLTFIVCIRNGDHDWINLVIIGWIIISGLFIGGKVLIDALAIAVRNAEIKATFGVGK